MTVDRFPIEAGHVMLFARAIGDPNPGYLDAGGARGGDDGAVVAPPTFVQASAQFDPDYLLRPKPGETWWGSGREATGARPDDDPDGTGGRSSGGALHAEQHYEYHRPLRVGDVLAATTHAGASWEKQGRSGSLVFSETITEYRDQAGELVVTARSVSVRTERPPTGAI